MAVVRPMVLAPAEYLLLYLALPGKAELCAGVLVLDNWTGRVEMRLREDWQHVAPAEDARILELLQEDLEAKAEEMGGAQLVALLEASLSNILRLGRREAANSRNLTQEADRLFRRFVLTKEETRIKVIPFRTHAPVYSLKAAATKFGEDMEVAAEGWAEIPPGVRPDENLFVAQVVGRSMEPKIPDGSYCLFRGGVAGTRDKKLVLVWRPSTERAGGEYTIKRYMSEKIVTEDDFVHTRIRLEPLNPEFEAWDLDENAEFQVIGVFVCVLDETEFVDA